MKKILLWVLLFSFWFIDAQTIEFTEYNSTHTFIERQNFEDYSYSYFNTLRDPDWNFKDINGDGLEELVHIKSIRGGYSNSLLQATLYVEQDDGAGNFSVIDSLNLPTSITITTPTYFIADIDTYLISAFTDANNDGFEDLLVIYQTEYTNTYFMAEVYLNDGTNHFSTTPVHSQLFEESLSINTNYYNVILNDFNGDGREDFLMTSLYEYNDYSGTYFINDGNGGYNINTNGNFDGIYHVLYDYDDDGLTDVLVLTGSLTNSIDYYKNLGGGQYDLSEIIIDIILLSNPIKVFQVGDFNNDGLKDFAIILQDKKFIRYVNNGTGYYSSAPIEEGAEYLKTGDFNNDGFQDVIVLSKNYTRICYNDGTGQFSTNNASFLLPGINFRAPKLDMKDINHDGLTDLIYTNPYGKIMIKVDEKRYMHSGICGIPVPPHNLPYKPGRQFEDIDGDGIKDFIQIGEKINNWNGNNRRITHVYKGTSSGFNPVPYMQFEQDMPYNHDHFRFADIDNDGDTDIIEVNSKPTDVGGSTVYLEENTIYSNDGAGNFTLFDLNIDPGNIMYVDEPVFYDFNNDGFLDILFPKLRLDFPQSSGMNKVRIYLNNASGNISSNMFSLAYEGTFDVVKVLDINMDGYLDFFARDPNNNNYYIYTNDGNLNFTVSTNFNFVSAPDFMDIDGDGDPDLVPYLNTSNVYENDGSGNFTDLGQIFSSLDFQEIKAISDFNNDGFDDFFAISNVDNYRKVFGNLGNNQFFEFNTAVNGYCFTNRCSAFPANINDDDYPDLFISHGNDKYYDVFLNISDAGGEICAVAEDYKQVRVDDHPVFDMSVVSASTVFTSIGLTNLGYYHNYQDAINQVNPLPATFTNTTDGPVEVVGRFQTPAGQIINIKFALDIVPDVYIFHPEVIANGNTTTVDITAIYGINTYYYTEANALQNQSPHSGNLTIDSPGRTVWLRGNMNGQVVASPITFSLIPNPYTYTVSFIPYSLYNVNNSSSLPNNDDSYSSIIPMNFDFNFFGNTFDSLVIGTNGTVSFDTSKASYYAPWQISNPIPYSYGRNEIFGVFQDLYNANGTGNIGYGEIGTAPFRKFVSFFDNLPLYGATNITATSQIILYETYDFIDVQVKHREPNDNWNNGNAIIGIQNTFENVAFYPPNRNTGNWTADNEAWRFRPDQSFPHYQYILCDANNDGVETFSTSNIINYFNSTGTGATYSLHQTEDDAQANTNPVTGNFQNTTNAQTLYVREDNNGNISIKRVLLAAIDCNADYDIDGVPTTTEDINANGNYGDDDTDGDGIPDFLDDDDDGDMVLTNVEILIFRTDKSVNYIDTDGDGIPNYLDNDDDGDGIPTIDEDYNGDGNPMNDDTNNDGIPDYLEQTDAPIPDNPNLPDLIGECEVTITTVPTATDAIDGQVNGIPSIDGQNITLPYTVDTQGVVVVTWTYTDNNGNSNSQIQLVRVNDMIAPEAVTNLTVNNITSQTIEISWDAATDNCEIQGYDLFLNGVYQTNTPDTSYIFNTLSPVTGYTLGVQSVDAADNTSAIVEITATTTEIETNDIVGLQIYPNPAEDFVEISINGQLAVIKVYDATGRLIKKYEPEAKNNYRIHVDGLTTGVYVLDITDVEKRNTRQALIVR